MSGEWRRDLDWVQSGEEITGGEGDSSGNANRLPRQLLNNDFYLEGILKGVDNWLTLGAVINSDFSLTEGHSYRVTRSGLNLYLPECPEYSVIILITEFSFKETLTLYPPINQYINYKDKIDINGSTRTYLKYDGESWIVSGMVQSDNNISVRTGVILSLDEHDNTVNIPDRYEKNSLKLHLNGIPILLNLDYEYTEDNSIIKINITGLDFYDKITADYMIV